MTWRDKPVEANGGSRHNGRQISQAERSCGSIGPSLYNDGKLCNAKAYNACSGMLRFVHTGFLTA